MYLKRIHFLSLIKIYERNEEVLNSPSYKSIYLEEELTLDTLNIKSFNLSLSSDLDTGFKYADWVVALDL